MYKLSIIIPLYNAGSFIERCATSLFEQTLADLEFIFVDDYSTDNSVDVLRRTVDKYPHQKKHVKLIQHKQNGGSAVARNTGLDNAIGKYIGWVDADDWVDTNMFEEMYKSAVSENADIVWTDFYNTYKESEKRINQYELMNSESVIRGLLSGRLLGGMCNKIIRSDLFIKYSLRFSDGLDMCEDLRMNVQLFYYATNVYYLNLSPYHYIKYKEDSISMHSVIKSKVNIGWIENVKGIESFLIEKKWADNFSTPILKMKLSSKKNLLIKGQDLMAFRNWREIFPESNSFVWQTKMPLRYKLLAWCADKEMWLVVRLWIFIKYRVFKAT